MLHRERFPCFSLVFLSSASSDQVQAEDLSEEQVNDCSVGVGEEVESLWDPDKVQTGGDRGVRGHQEPISVFLKVREPDSN